MENEYRITKLHGTLIGDNRIPDLPAGEKTKVFSSTNGKTAWVDLPTDVGKDANGFAVLRNDGVEIAGQRKSVKLADVRENGAVIGRDQTTSAPQADELITKAYADKAYVQLNKDNEFKSGTLSFGLDATLQTESISGGTVGNAGSSTIMLIPSGNDSEGTISFVSNGSAFSMGFTGMAINTTGDFFVGEDFSSLNPAWKAVTGLLSPWQFGDLTKGYEAIGFVNAKDFEGRANAPSPSRLTFFSPLGKVSWFDMAGNSQYDYQLPKKSGTIALTSDIQGGGGGASVSPCLNLVDFSGNTPVVRTSITEEEKNNIDNRLYSQVIYIDQSLGQNSINSIYFPEIFSLSVDNIFSIYRVLANESSGIHSIVGLSTYAMDIGEKNTDGTYPITIEKMLEATFGGGGGSSTSLSFKDVTVSELANHVGKFENLHITDMKVALTILGSEQEFTGVYFSGTCSGANLYGTAWLPQGTILGCGTFIFDTVTKTIKNGECSLGGTLSAVSVGNIFMPGAYTEFNSKYGADLIPTAIDIGSALFVGKAEINNSGTQCIAYVGINNAAPTGDETWCSLTGMFGNKGFGVAEFKKGADGNPSFKSFTTWLPPVTSASDGKALIVTGGNAQWTTTPRYEHTITIKNSEGKILWTQTMRNSSNTIVNSYTNLKTLFGEATYAGFGEYCQLDLRGGTEATDKLIKADGTEATLASLGAIVYTDVCFLPK